MGREGSIQLNPLTEALGAEVIGVDWSSDIDADTASGLRAAWLKHHVLIFRHQHLSPEQFITFGRTFGDIELVTTYGGLDGYPEIMPLIKEPGDKVNVGEGWHIDSTYRDTPPAGAALYSIEVPPQGGDTLFANMCLAYESLSDGLKTLLSTVRVIHANGFLGDAAARKQREAQLAMKVRAEVKVVTAEHPMVRTHPDSRRKSLFVNPMVADGGMIANFVEMTAAETAPLVHYLTEHAGQERFTLRVTWEPGMIVLYDNRCLQHNAPNDYQGFRREMWRISLAGDKPE